MGCFKWVRELSEGKLPKDLAEDSMFPFKTERSMKIKISFKVGEKKLMIEPLEPGLKGRAERERKK